MELQVNLHSLFDLDLHQVACDASPAHSQPMHSAPPVSSSPIGNSQSNPDVPESAPAASRALEPYSQESLQVLDDPLEWSAFSRPVPSDLGCWESNVVIEGMHCAACSLTVEEALTRIPGSSVRKWVQPVTGQSDLVLRSSQTFRLDAGCAG